MERFGRLEVQAIVVRQHRRRKRQYAICNCDCGRVCEIRYDGLKSGRQVSCGCFQAERNRTSNLKHGGSHTRLFKVWHSMKMRCLSPADNVYKYYGGRGITICGEWMEFVPFRDWAARTGYRTNLTIERIDNNKGYSPSNCKWATMREQGNNRRNNVRVTFSGLTLTLMQWSERLGINHNTLRYRIKHWPVEKAFAVPVIGDS